MGDSETIEEKIASIPIEYLEWELINRFEAGDIHRSVRFIKEVMAIRFNKEQCALINPNCNYQTDEDGRLYQCSPVSDSEKSDCIP